MNLEETNQLYHEIHTVINRYAKEDDLTTFQIVGTLHAVSFDYLMENRIKENDVDNSDN